MNRSHIRMVNKYMEGRVLVAGGESLFNQITAPYYY
jgi:hypothetical protein